MSIEVFRALGCKGLLSSMRVILFDIEKLPRKDRGDHIAVDGQGAHLKEERNCQRDHKSNLICSFYNAPCFLDCLSRPSYMRRWEYESFRPENH